MKIDVSKLTRDYTKEPLKKNGRFYEKIPYEDLYEMFITQDMSKPEIIEFTGISMEGLKTQLHNNGLKKENVKKEVNFTRDEIYDLYITKNTRYDDMLKILNIGVRKFNDILREYNISKPKTLMYDNYKKTNLQKYGVENQFQLEEIKEKSAQANLEKYGVTLYAKTTECHQKAKETRIERYGEKDPYNREKAKQTLIDRYGVDNMDYINFTEEQMRLVKDKDYLINYIKEHNIKNATELSIKSKLTISTANAISNNHNIRYLYDYTGSHYERIIQQIVEQVGLEYIPNYKMKNKQEIDVYIPKLNLGFEFNGNYWHSEKFRPADYHQNKSLAAQEQGIFIYHIFEYQWQDNSEKVIREIAELVGLKTIYTCDYEIKEIPNEEAKIFLEENSFYEIKEYNKIYGLYVNNKLIHIQCYINFDKDNWSLVIDCNLLNEDYDKGSEKLLKWFEDHNTYKNLLAITNIGFKNENLPLELGFNYYGCSDPTSISCPSEKLLDVFKNKSLYNAGTKLYNRIPSKIEGILL